MMADHESSAHRVHMSVSEIWAVKCSEFDKPQSLVQVRVQDLLMQASHKPDYGVAHAAECREGALQGPSMPVQPEQHHSPSTHLEMGSSQAEGLPLQGQVHLHTLSAEIEQVWTDRQAAVYDARMHVAGKRHFG